MLCNRPGRRSSNTKSKGPARARSKAHEQPFSAPEMAQQKPQKLLSSQAHVEPGFSSKAESWAQSEDHYQAQ